MSERTRTIRDQARRLSTKELSHLVADLSAELDERDGLVLGPEWDAEIKRRLDEIDSGKVKMIPWEVAEREIFGKTREPTRSKRPSRSKSRAGRCRTVVRGRK